MKLSSSIERGIVCYSDKPLSIPLQHMIFDGWALKALLCPYHAIQFKLPLSSTLYSTQPVWKTGALIFSNTAIFSCWIFNVQKISAKENASMKWQAPGKQVKAYQG